MSLTHDCSTSWAESGYKFNTQYKDVVGLTDFGREVVAEANKLGIILDLSRAHPRTVQDVLNVTQAPFIFSHSGVFALSDYSENIVDEVLQIVKERRSVVMVTFLPPAICQNVRDMHLKVLEGEEIYDDFLNTYIEQNKVTPLCTVEDVVKVVEYVNNSIGIDHIGLGAGFDGL